MPTFRDLRRLGFDTASTDCTAGAEAEANFHVSGLRRQRAGSRQHHPNLERRYLYPAKPACCLASCGCCGSDVGRFESPDHAEVGYLKSEDVEVSAASVKAEEG